MRVHMISKIDDIIFLLRSRLIPLGTLEDAYIYKRIPKINNDEFIISFDIFDNELSYIKMISKDIYYFNKSISTEYRNIQILYSDNINGNKIENLKNIYKEIKDINLKTIKKTVNYNATTYTSPIPMVKGDIFINLEQDQVARFDKLKGSLYMFIAYFPKLAEAFLDNHITMHSYFIKTQDLINDLRQNNLLNKEIYNSSRRFLNQLEKNTLVELENTINNKALFTINSNYKILFSFKGLNLSNSEIFLFNHIFHFIIENKEIVVKDLILYISKIIKSYKELKMLIEDIDIIIDRVINQNYLIDINSIDSVLLKNLYSFSINYKDAKGLYFFNKKTQLSQPYLSFMLYGLYTGYSNITNALIFDDLMNPFSNKVLLKSIKDLEDACFDLKKNMQYTRDRLFYIILLVINGINITNNKFKNIIINQNNNNHIRTLEIVNDSDSIVIEYYLRTQNMAKNIEYFDIKIKRLNILAKNNILQQNDFVFSYHFKRGKEKIALNLDLEKKYMILLEYIYKESK